MKRIAKWLLYIMMVVFLMGCIRKADQTDDTENIKDGAELVISSLSENTAGANGLEDLRELYIHFPQTANYQKAISFIQESELPYVEGKQNGSRTIKIALEKPDTEDTVVSTFEDYDYIEVSYLYPKEENDDNDEVDKYFFVGICYVSSRGKYQLESHAESTFITRDGEVIDYQMDRQEQMYFLKEHTD